MSVRGAIIIHQCDGCPTVEIMNLDRGVKSDWYLGVHVDYCPQCRHKIEHQAVILDEETVWTAVADRIATAVSTRIKEIPQTTEEALNVH